MNIVKVHEYLGMTLRFSAEGKVNVIMDAYVEKTIQTLPEKLKSTDIVIIPDDFIYLGMVMVRYRGDHKLNISTKWLRRLCFIKNIKT